jgi:D-alanyl-D-alanine-carboxypeptidase/D-alanyl-D-alanine-endopeptidase
VGYLLERVYGQPYAALLQRQIEQPLGMQNGLAPATAAQPVAEGYNPQHQRMPRMLGPMYHPVAALTYSADDLLHYVAYQVAEADPAVRLTHRPKWGTLATQAIGFNWSLNRTVEGQRALHASGSSFGYASYCDLYPAARLGVVV